MRYLPINLNIRGKQVVVIGGGAVAARKCLTLLDAGALVTIIAPVLADPLGELARNGEVSYLGREYVEGDLSGAFLVFAATESHTVNLAVAKEAKKGGILADITDAPDLSDFTSPAVISRGDLLMTVATGGESPALAAKIRAELADLYGPEYSLILKLLGRVREKLLTEKTNNSYNKKILKRLVEQDLAALFKRNSDAEIDHLLRNICGPGFTLAALGMGEKDQE